LVEPEPLFSITLLSQGPPLGVGLTVGIIVGEGVTVGAIVGVIVGVTVGVVVENAFAAENMLLVLFTESVKSAVVLAVAIDENATKYILPRVKNLIMMFPLLI